MYRVHVHLKKNIKLSAEKLRTKSYYCYVFSFNEDDIYNNIYEIFTTRLKIMALE
jgi:hypothetical protein